MVVRAGITTQIILPLITVQQQWRQVRSLLRGCVATWNARMLGLSGEAHFHIKDTCMLGLPRCLFGTKWPLSRCLFHNIGPTKDICL